MRIGCIILAAGKSTRFGENKLLASLDGLPLLAHCIQAVPKPLFCQILAVASHPDVAELCRDGGIEVCMYGGGPQSQSIRTGLQSLSRADGCLFVMGDQPLCSKESITGLVAAFREDPKCVCRLSFAGQPSSPTLFPSHLFPALMQLTGERGGMAAVGNTPIRYVEARGPHELWDADTPEQFLKIQTYLRTPPHTLD